MDRPAKPLLVFDGDCDFCRQWIARWRRVTGDRVDYAPYQAVAARFPEIPVERFAAAVQLIEPGGRRSGGAEAVFRSLACAPGRGRWLELYETIPGFAAVSEWCYRLVAGHRSIFTRLTRWVWGAHVVPPGEALTCWIYLRLLGVVYAVAFLSLGVQVLGLIGSDGVLPAGAYLDAVARQVGAMRYWFAPTLLWIHCSDLFLVGWCAVGGLLSLLLIAGIAPIPSLVGLWAVYLSLVTVGQDFFWFQWDGLLLEAGFLAIFLAPWRGWSRPAGESAPPRLALWLTRWLLFRLVFASAVVKLASGDPTWRHLTALTYHYETQPLPPWTAWFMHQLPAWFHRLSAGVMFAIEGVAPLFVFAPRRIRFAAVAAMAGLQGLIVLTGNYGFFNLLTLALLIPLLDDGVWPRRWQEAIARGEATPRRWPRWVLRPAAAVLFLLSLVPLLHSTQWRLRWLDPLTSAYRYASPFRTVNSYGLFAVMTTRRLEIIVEGSRDGLTWRPYEFGYKPGDVDRRPAFMAPHMPRLDWQMWFAALSDFRREPWFLRLCEQLLRGSPPVLALLAKNPFPDGPPRYLRATFYDYHFTDPATRRATGAWWRRQPLALYCPVLTLEQGRLTAVPELTPSR